MEEGRRVAAAAVAMSAGRQVTGPRIVLIRAATGQDEAEAASEAGAEAGDAAEAAEAAEEVVVEAAATMPKATSASECHVALPQPSNPHNLLLQPPLLCTLQLPLSVTR